MKRISGCNEVRRIEVDKGDVTDMFECLRGGRVLSTTWNFAGDPHNPATLPLLVDVIEPADEEFEPWTQEPGPTGILRALPEEKGLREITWRQDGVRYRALVHAVTEKDVDNDGIPKRRGTFGDYRLVSLEIGPRVANAEAPKPLPRLIETLIGQPAIEDGCVADRTLSLTTVCRELVVENETIQSAEWTFHARESLTTLGSLETLAKMPEEVLVVSESDPWEREGVTEFSTKIVRWQTNDVDWTAELYAPPVLAYYPAESTWRWRAARKWESRLRRVKQIPIDRAPPLDPAAPRIRFGDVPKLFTDKSSVRPEPAYRPNPQYPPRLRWQDIRGEVDLKLLVSEGGVVQEIILLRSAPGFDQGAIDTVATWKYKPVLVDGRAILWRSNVILRFRLR